MGKRLITQRRGKGSVHMTPSHRHHGPAKHPLARTPTTAVITDLTHDPGHSAPTATIELSNGEEHHVLATEGTRVGQKIQILGTDVQPGNILALKKVPEGTPVYNIEGRPGDGGKFVRAAGTTALLVGRTEKEVTVRLPSGQFKTFHPDCRAVIGVAAGGGRGDKPFAKAGKVHHAVRSKGKLFPRVRGVAKNPVDHPHGGGNAHRKEGKPTTVARGTPPGRNIGHIAARRTGLKKG